MPYKDRKKQLAAQAKHYADNKEDYRKRDRKRKCDTKLWFLEYKMQFSCTKCPENHPACLVFHHRDPTKKIVEISVAVSNRWSKEKILEEIEKCDVLCSNCHLKHHFKENGVWASKVFD